MRIGTAVKLKKRLPNTLQDLDAVGLVVKKPYAFLQKTGPEKTDMLIETRAVDVLFGGNLVEGVPVNFLEIV